ncbi:hypothetical protein Syun_005262 [Stephania yunnanensis]|uniref:Uncharacterized protein n=1 Tax=Stephania yunnanensis TaxID=152371 RepID=A0AAP0L5F0_9MAGN
MDNECTADDGGLLKLDVVEGTDDETKANSIAKTSSLGKIARDVRLRRIGAVSASLEEFAEIASITRIIDGMANRMALASEASISRMRWA